MNLIEAIRHEIERNPKNRGAYEDFFSVIRKMEESDYNESHKENKWLRNATAKGIKEGANVYDIYKRALLFDARDDFDAYMLYLESNRMPEERFYQPRRKVLKRAVEGMQELIDGDIDELFVSQPPRTGKTTLLIFLYTWLLGRDPEKSNLYSAYSDQITTAFYNGVLEVINDPYTYLWKEVFPERKLVSTNAKDETLDIDRKKRYASLTTRSIFGSLNGACDCSGLLASDDLIGGIEEAINPIRLDKTWSTVENNLLTRKKSGAKILWNGTRWSLIDPIGKRLNLLETDKNFQNRKYKVINLKALDENDESNFNYDYNKGFSTKEYYEIRASFEHNNDMASWFAQYQQEPIEREGTLFTPDTMRFFSGSLPEAFKVFMPVDPAFGGGDFVSGPICWRIDDNIDGDIFVPDVIYDDRDKKETIPRLVDKVIKYNVRYIQFYVNKMTMSYKEEFEKLLKETHPEYKITITTKPDSNKTSKNERIFDSAPDIRDRMIFRSDRSKEYDRFMQNMYGFTVLGKNKHDDAPDSCSMAIDMNDRPYGMYKVFKKPF